MKTADTQDSPFPGEEAQAPEPEDQPGAQLRSGSESTPLARLHADDTSALREILQTHWEGCVLYARSLLDHPDPGDQAEDLAQEAFVRLWEHRHEWTAETPPRPLLLKILRNLALNEERRLDVRRRWAHRVEESQRRLNPTPHQHLRARRVRERARRAVDALPTRRREVFLLVRVQGLTYEEVAQTMGISRQTVANQMGAALQTLREALEPHL